MVEGPSGLLAVARSERPIRWCRERAASSASPRGAKAFVYSGAKRRRACAGPSIISPGATSSPNGASAEAAWDNLMLGLRLGARPRALVTTTPRPMRLLRRLSGDRGHGDDAAGGRATIRTCPSASSRRWSRSMRARGWAGRSWTGELIEDVEGALWTRRADRAVPRIAARAPNWGAWWSGSIRRPRPRATPAGSSRAGWGATAAAMCSADASVAGSRPRAGRARWRRGGAAWGADRGGRREEPGRRHGGERAARRRCGAAGAAGPCRARQGRAGRAGGGAVRERGRRGSPGRFPELEDELCGLHAGGGYEGPGRSPDRADAMVWAMTELMLGKRGAARVTVM